MVVEEINGSYIGYTNNHIPMIRDYYLYCIKLFRQQLLKNSYNINIIFGNYQITFNNTNNTYKIDIQYEHTLVKPGGRDSDNSVIGNIFIDHEKKYLVRIDNLSYLNKLDGIIEYSLPNYINIEKSEKFDEFLEKVIYISPTISDAHFNSDRNIEVLTTFQNINEPRRNKLLNDIAINEINHVNVNNCYDKSEVFNLYNRSKILVNIHQTHHHDTVEEFRILPALLCGCVIISEKSPLYETLPYNQFIIWSEYSDIISTIKKVINDYNYYYNNIYNSSNIIDIIDDMKSLNEKNINNWFLKLFNR